VHPAPAPHRTLQNALLHPRWRSRPALGHVHVSDKDTSGLSAVAKTLEAHTHLVRQLAARTVHREYLALASNLRARSAIEAPIGRHPTRRTTMAMWRPATRANAYHVVERFGPATLLMSPSTAARTRYASTSLRSGIRSSASGLWQEAARRRSVGGTACGARARLALGDAPRPGVALTAARRLRTWRRRARPRR
jgi:hypothetical protein